MSKYFAKLLPVPGEIKAGDLCKTADGIVCALTDPHELLFANRNGYSRMAMHLCSAHAIPEVGEEMVCLVPNYFGQYFKVTSVPTHSRAQCADSPLQYQHLRIPEQLVKVIGLISPGAKWVTEGMEFDKSQVWLRTYSGPRDLPDLGKWKIRPEIKCPSCGTFH